MPPTISVEDVSQMKLDPFETVLGFLRDYNKQFYADDSHTPLVLFARDADGRIRGGIRGVTAWGWTFVAILAVDPELRRQGVGRQLLAKAEEVTLARGGIGLHLTTVAFQAPEFYKRQGYTQFGQIGDFPPGSMHYFFAKRLDGKPLAA